MHNTDEAVITLLTQNSKTDDNLAAIFCSFKRTLSNKLNFPIPDLTKLILQTLQKLFTLFTGTTLTGVVEALLPRIAIP